MCTLLTMEAHAQEMMKEFVEGLKETYIERQLSCEEQWPPVSVKKLINLQLIEAEKKEGFRAGLPQHGAHDDKVKRTPILHGDLFKFQEGNKPVRKLIVEGNAGIGKTTLCTMLTEEWANGDIFRQFDCVLLFPLRDQLVASASSLSDLLTLYHPDETVCGAVVQQLKRTRGKNVLIIADGWDELSEENRSKKSFIYNLLFGRFLPSASVLLTSRPSASAPFHNLPTVDRLVEVVGFNEENVKQYIESEFEKFPEKASSLIEQLENNPVIGSVCSVPLNCAIICNLWHTLDSVLPKTLTDLYTQIVLNVILRNVKKSFVECPSSLQSFDSIPTDLQDLFWLTCKFAYQCLSQDQIVFVESEVVNFFPGFLNFQHSNKFLCFGLLQCAQSLLPVGQGLSFHFVHLTIQEFLAALHLVTLSNEEKLKVCEAHAESVRFAMVWRFMFGLGCKKEGSYSRKVVCLDDEVVDRFLTRCRDYRVNWRLMLCHCSMESLNHTVHSKTAKEINGRFENSYGMTIAHTTHDCVAVFQVLQHTSHCSYMNINIKLSHCGLTEKLLTELTDILSRAGGRLQVKDLSLYGNKLTDKGITDLFNRASASLSSLKYLSLEDNKITNIMFPYCNTLSFLHLSHNPLGVSGIQSLETAVLASMLVNLRVLCLSNTLTDDADINGALLATLLPSISSHCPHLWTLKLSKNNLGVPGASALGGLFTRLSSRSMWDIALSDTNINAEAVAAFTITTRPSEPSFNPFCDHTIDLSDNPLGYDGLLAIFRMFHCEITSLYLDNTNLTTPVNIEPQYQNIQLSNTVLNLDPILKGKRLTSLSLNENNFSGDRVLILAECVRVCRSLEYLHSGKCSLTSSEVTSFLEHLKVSGCSHTNLRVWYLWDNSIDDGGVSALTDSLLELFPSLEDVDLGGNRVSGDVEDRLRKILKVSFCVSLFEVVVIMT